jgi:prepilin-type N-terminal cleavage/methylation domain-containing protein
MFNRANLTPVEAAPKAFWATTLQWVQEVCSHGPVRLSLKAGSVGRSGRCSHGPMGRRLQQRSCRNGSQSRGYKAGFTLPKHRGPESVRGFTLTELLVTMSVLVLLVFLFTQLLNSAATTMTLGNRRMDADSQARQLLDRMAIDFDQMLTRTDVSYYVKTTGNTQAGNDQIAFFSAVPGYYSQAAYNSNASLVAYRVNADSTSASYNKLERMGKGFPLNGAYTTAPIPLLFRDGTTNTTIQGVWPAAASPTTADPDYETAGPQVFRFEYYYLLSSSPSVGTANQLTAGPWSSTDTFLVKEVAAIVVAIAVIDPKDKTLLDTVDPTGAKLKRLNGADGQAPLLVDYDTASMTTPGQLLTTWRTALDANTVGLPQPAISGIRLYERYFYLSQ